MDALANILAATWELVSSLFGWVDWSSPWTWLAIFAGFMVLGAANR